MRKLVFAVFAVFASGCGNSSPPPVPPTPAGGVPWYFQGGGGGLSPTPGMPASPAALPGGVFQFTFPTATAVNYLVTPKSGALANAVELSYRVDVNGAVTFTYPGAPDACGTPASVVLYFQEAGDDVSGVGQYEFYRWWAPDTRTVLAPGTFAIKAPITPDKWSDVQGKPGTANPAGFAQAASNVAFAGMTFSGGCSFGHGAYAVGQAVFNALSFGAN